ncbi:ATP-dependent 6-phosphofructokinase [Pseudarthrobacter enclensis]|uniref:ATP-dependent 6-phosphofructokinase n=1 Tax=Pseudarthrobacter enclensis TaxID=993070 RepID=A0ABT9S195_9MICC|nr:ATP-dependent 6-phosphofructokinase [Pseudarthrobacter enclensis]MDP9890770.1 6-phosphofructokinase 1 [Pseudarthrobacter enclensis]
MARIGLLTSGGDCPGLNAVIRACVLRGIRIHGDQFVGFADGWRGLIEGSTLELDWKSVRGIGGLGGTILGTSRTNPLGDRGGVERIASNLRVLGVDALIVIGGEGTLAVANILSNSAIPIVGVPKTIDNDLFATDFSFGFHTAVEIATEAIDRLKTTGESHHRCMIAEVMGRHAGWIALYAGMATSAHAILIPEQKASIEDICEWVEGPVRRGRPPLVVVAEGFLAKGMSEPHSERGLDAFDRPRLGGIGEHLAPIIEERTGIETRSTTLGHIQRGGAPCATDRVLCTRLGLAAVDAVHDGAWGQMVATRGDEIVRVSLADSVGRLKTVPQSRYDEATYLFG